MQLRLLVFLGHPAHFHLFKNIISDLQNKGHQVRVLIRSKDILEDLCRDAGIEYQNVLPESRRHSVFSIGVSYLRKYRRISRVIRKFRPGLLLGSEPSLTHLGRFFKIPSFVFSEDDVSIIPQFAAIAYPFVSVILSPNTCNAGSWEKKKIGYDGFHKLVYLHPSVFVPDSKKISNIFPGDYFILRFADLRAYHDTNRKGIDREMARKIINLLQGHGKVYITSERELEPEFEQYRLRINPLHIHHALSFCKLFIGDSQSMAVEASLLGTANLRFNDFAGEIGVLNELERKYELSYAYKTNQETEFFAQLQKLLGDKNLKQTFAARRDSMLGEKINVFKFFMWFIENYPASKEIMQKNPEHQYTFR